MYHNIIIMNTSSSADCSCRGGDLVSNNQTLMVVCPEQPPSMPQRWTMAMEMERTAAVQAEVERMKRMPLTSAYAGHRLRVLKKLIQLLSEARTQSEMEEVEFLLGGLSL
eukprot:c18651_g1_i1 orf=173-502(+)